MVQARPTLSQRSRSWHKPLLSCSRSYRREKLRCELPNTRSGSVQKPLPLLRLVCRGLKNRTRVLGWGLLYYYNYKILYYNFNILYYHYNKERKIFAQAGRSFCGQQARRASHQGLPPTSPLTGEEGTTVDDLYPALPRIRNIP